MRAVVATLLILCAAAPAVGLTAGCGKRKQPAATPSPLLHASAPHDQPVDVAHAARDAETLRLALTRPHRAGAALGAHRFAGSSTLHVSEAGAEVEALDISESIEVAADGSFHVLAKNSKDYGREAVFVPASAGGELWIRPGFGKFHHRAPSEPDEPARLVDETFATLGADFDLVASAATVSDAGATTVAGRPAHKITLALGKAGPHPETLPQRKWREGVTVLALTGEVSLDDATGLPLAGRLTARVGFVREGHSYEMELEATHAVSDVGGAIAIAPPAAADSIDTPQRSHDFDDREELLHGIAPPARRGPVGASK